MIIQNLALPERTYYEPMTSTHPDTQGFGNSDGLGDGGFGDRPGCDGSKDPVVRG